MPPALHHKKTRTGCKRCKSRKVKCDEGKPKCTACSRHSVECEYPHLFEAERHSSAGPGPSPRRDPEASFDHDSLELRLMHQWTAHTSETISTAREFWKLEVPLVGMRYRYILDGIFALAALQLHKQSTGRWRTLQGANPPSQKWLFPNATKPDVRDEEIQNVGSPMMPSDTGLEGYDMLDVSRKFFARGLEGHRQDLVEINEQNIRAAFIYAVVVSVHTLFTIVDESEDAEDSPPIGLKWVSISRGASPVSSQWNQLVGKSWILKVGSMYGQPDMSDSAELFRPDHREDFNYLLASVADDRIRDADRQAYEDTLSYIGLFHKGIVKGLDAPLATMRRILSLPARVPQRFVELASEGQPRAIAMLAHFFAIMKLTEERLPWIQGVALAAVPKLCEALPEQWRHTVDWPLSIMNGD